MYSETTQFKTLRIVISDQINGKYYEIFESIDDQPNNDRSISYGYDINSVLNNVKLHLIASRGEEE
jgi:hypothetical protein